MKFFERCREYTMVDAQTFCDNLALAERVKNIPGCVVECGVWKGGMIAGLCMALGDSRCYYLFDSFQGLPAAKQIDGASAIKWQNNTDSPAYYDNCAAGKEFAISAMKLAKAKRFELFPGWFNDTVPQFNPNEPIALLRLDADWYDSTTICLESLFKKVAPGGLILIDDYYTWDGCSKAVHDFLSRNSMAERIQHINSVCFLEKRPA